MRVSWLRNCADFKEVKTFGNVQGLDSMAHKEHADHEKYKQQEEAMEALVLKSLLR